MDESAKVHRIYKLNLKNIAAKNYFKPVSERNNIFLSLKRNKSILSHIKDEC